MEEGLPNIDHIDKAILAYLQQDGRTPYTAIASQLGVSEGTIRKRAKRLEEEGYFRIVGVANPMHIGLDTVICIWIKVERGQTQAVVSELVAFDEIRYTSYATGTYDLIAMVVLPSSQLRNFLESKLSAVAGIREKDISFVLDIRKQTYDWAPWSELADPNTNKSTAVSPEFRVDEMDRKIIGYLQRNGRWPYSEIAAALGVTERSIRRRVLELREANVLRIVGVTNPFKVGMNTIAVVALQVEQDRLEDVVEQISAHRQVRYVALASGVYDIIFEVILQSNQELFRFLVENLTAIPGILRTDTSLVLNISKLEYEDIQGLGDSF